MTNPHRVLDAYWRNARVYPAVLAALPSLVTLAAIWPAYSSGRSSGGVAALSVLGITYFAASLARSRGKKVERRLKEKWGGWPTTVWLRHRAGLVPSLTLARYHSVLGELLQTQFPSRADEEKDPLGADQIYASAVECLKEHRRSSEFALVHKENAEYGFRRNLRGLKGLAVSLSLVVIAALCGYLLYLSAGDVRQWAVLLEQRPVFLFLLMEHILSAAAWVMIVDDAWVTEAADSYARALLATCDRSSKVV